MKQYLHQPMGTFCTAKDEEMFKRELKEILNFRKIYLPQAGERNVFNPLIQSFFNYPGIFINGFEPNQYLKEFHQAAEE